MQRLFVYGSLKRGFRHHGLLAGSELECAASTARGFCLVLQGEYPALVRRGGRGSVEGEVYRVTEELLVELDRFEGCPEYYQRESIPLDDGSSALSYVIPPERALALPAVPGSRWTESPLPDSSTP
jgi:gamma-glutamylaminecyclotransferase